MSANGSIMNITDMPAEILDIICHELTLEDIANLQAADPILDRAIDFIFFPQFTKMRVTMDDKGAMITISPRSTRSYLEHSSFSIAGDSLKRMQILRACTSVESLTISCSDHHQEYYLLDAINRADIALTKLVVNSYTPRDCPDCRVPERKVTDCVKKISRSYRKLNEFVKAQSPTLTTLKVSTSEEDSVLVELRTSSDGASTESHVVYAHNANTALHHQFIFPLFTDFNQGKPSGPSSVHLTVDWRSQLHLALQSAFLVALPIGHRAGVQKMRIGFSSKVSLASLSHDEIHSCLAQFADQLCDTRRLKELICDFKNSNVDPCQLDSTISVLSKQLQLCASSAQSSHRIRVLFDAPAMEEPTRNLIKEEWAMLPRVY